MRDGKKMRRAHRWLATTLAVTGMAGALTFAASPAGAAEAPFAPVQACYVQGLGVSTSGAYATGSVARYNCGDYVRLDGEIFKDISFWPDPQIGYNDRWLYNGTVGVRGRCDGFGSYYTAATSSTNQYDESGRYGAC